MLLQAYWVKMSFLFSSGQQTDCIVEHKRRAKKKKSEKGSMCSEMFVKMSGKRERLGDSFPIELSITLHSTC